VSGDCIRLSSRDDVAQLLHFIPESSDSHLSWIKEDWGQFQNVSAFCQAADCLSCSCSRWWNLPFLLTSCLLATDEKCLRHNFQLLCYEIVLNKIIAAAVLVIAMMLMTMTTMRMMMMTTMYVDAAADMSDVMSDCWPTVTEYLETSLC